MGERAALQEQLEAAEATTVVVAHDEAKRAAAELEARRKHEEEVRASHPTINFELAPPHAH